METTVSITATTKEDIYSELIPQIDSLLSGEDDTIANLANVSAALKVAFSDVSWVGFYLMKQGGLVLGPFQGKPACVRIQLGKGVCGTAAAKRETLIVPNVLEFPGHIFCDPDSRSEIVVPIVREGKTVGVLDLDSPALNTFDSIDAKYLEQIVKLLPL